MILFLNFAPIEFMGGAEKWMNETAKRINNQEHSTLVSVDKSISSIYSSLVLDRKFDSRANSKDIHNHTSLDIQCFFPFTSKWFKTRELFKNSRLIYARYEVPEFFILLYFAGLPGLKKTIAGLHSPFIYTFPETFFEKLHNKIYQSHLSKKILSTVKKIHVMNKSNLKFFSKHHKFDNVVYVPNSTKPQNSTTTIMQDNKLHILFVGELSKRKGVDRLISVIKNSPENYIFTLAGDGPLKDKVEALTQTHYNCIYKGHVDSNSMSSLYKSNEILFLPSRAESMPLSILEALSFGLTIVDSNEITLDLDKNIEFSSKNNTTEDYLKVLKKIEKNKQSKKLSAKNNQDYFLRNFSRETVDPILYKEVFEI